MKVMVKTDIYIVLKNLGNTGNINRGERQTKRIQYKYNRGVNIIGVIDNCLNVTAIGLGITVVSILSTIVAAPAVIGMEAVSIFMGLFRVLGNRAIKKMSLKIEKHEQIAMLAVSTLNAISSLISQALSDNSISDEEYSLILLEFETLTRMKEDLNIKSKTSLEKLVIQKLKLVSSLSEKRQLQLELMFKTIFKTMFKTMFKTVFEK